MTITRMLGLTATTLALMVTPALAQSPTPSAKGKAYGKYCQTESRKHTAGQHGTPFSLCVTAMAKLANGGDNNPRTACKDESKQHTAGQHGTPFSLCVSGAAKQLQNQAGSDTQPTTAS
jgi:hypothetical protein